MLHDEQTSREWYLSRGSFLFLGRTNQVNDCLVRLSNHLQMKWQTTPAMTAIKKEKQT